MKNFIKLLSCRSINMAAVSRNFLANFVLALMICSVFLSDLANAQGLKVGFYPETCPQVEEIVAKTMSEVLAEAPSLAGPLLRMQYHDCFVRGCDGSLLLDSPTGQAEKNAIPNLTLRGFNIIDRVKTAVEEACPGVVSCADIVVIVARDVTTATKGPYWDVETGRRDDTISNITEALLNLVPPTSNITVLQQAFLQRGLSMKDLAVLQGAHTIGTSHCSSFSNRLYNFTANGGADPSLDPNYVVRLKMACKPNDNTTLVEMDPGSFLTFDEGYYKDVAKRRGLFQSDSALLYDPTTKAYVEDHTNSNEAGFFVDFAESMVKMGRLGVLTGSQGQVRKNCRKVN